MGSLIVKKVIYSGDKYSYESPELHDGINIIIGNNGSGKSTFTYLIEYCLGGYLKYFNEGSQTEKYEEIVKDSNNYVELLIKINNELYLLKRFINGNIIHINHGNNYFSYPIYRQQSEANTNNEIFSDWLLDKLSITAHEINLGTRSWKLNINDLFRLIIYDQETAAKKIFKEPTNLNFVTDSLIIRKTIFEVLLGISSEDYFRKFEEYKKSISEKEKEQLKIENFEEKYSGIDLNIDKINESIISHNTHLEKLYNQRDLFTNSNNKIDEKSELINSVQEEIIRKEIRLSEVSIELRNNEVEYDKISAYFRVQSNEINEIEKIIFTNDKLNLFSFKICPFCMAEHEPKDSHCLCGAEIVNEDYEKFRYTSKEYENILKHRKKSLETIQIALDSYSKEINSLNISKDTIVKEIEKETHKLKTLISSTEVNTNKNAIDLLHNEILAELKLIESEEYKLKIAEEKKIIDDNFDEANKKYKRIKAEYEELQKKFERNNTTVIKDFNDIYLSLILDSSADVAFAEINEDYMPLIDDGIYKNKSAGVPIRLVYYYTILALALKYENVKHPKLLIIDTPEDSGIDDINLKNDLELIENVLSDINLKDKQYQIILTTGLEKYPEIYEDYIIETFNKDLGDYILKPISE